jgi:hypothetical protein
VSYCPWPESPKHCVKHARFSTPRSLNSDSGVPLRQSHKHSRACYNSDAQLRVAKDNSDDRPIKDVSGVLHNIRRIRIGCLPSMKNHQTVAPVSVSIHYCPAEKDCRIVHGQSTRNIAQITPLWHSELPNGVTECCCAKDIDIAEHMLQLGCLVEWPRTIATMDLSIR